MNMKIVGHRGAAGLARENSLIALKKGLEHHADMLEFDLRVTADRVVVLHHDESIDMPDGSPLSIKNSSYGLLKQHDSQLATFTEVLDSLPNSAALYVEIKPDVDLGPIIKILKDNKDRKLTLASFGQKELIELHQALPDLPLIVIESWWSMRAQKRARQLGTRQIAMNERWLWPGFIITVTKRGWQLYAYTLNDYKKAWRWQKYGIYGVITDYPDLFDKIKP
jgi:glycerophosphoryl diester phosphodiesterase